MAVRDSQHHREEVYAGMGCGGVHLYRPVKTKGGKKGTSARQSLGKFPDFVFSGQLEVKSAAKAPTSPVNTTRGIQVSLKRSTPSQSGPICQLL